MYSAKAHASSDKLVIGNGCPSWLQAEDSSGRHASQIQEHQEAAAATKKAAVAAQAELKKVCSLPSYAWLFQHILGKC